MGHRQVTSHHNPAAVIPGQHADKSQGKCLNFPSRNLRNDWELVKWKGRWEGLCIRKKNILSSPTSALIGVGGPAPPSLLGYRLSPHVVSTVQAGHQPQLTLLLRQDWKMSGARGQGGSESNIFRNVA